jgi:hypothetical protein
MMQRRFRQINQISLFSHTKTVLHIINKLYNVGTQKTACDLAYSDE